MKIIEGKIHNEKGLTSRLAALLVGEANHFKSNLTIKVFDETADLKSIMNVMALVIPDCFSTIRSLFHLDLNDPVRMRVKPALVQGMSFLAAWLPVSPVLESWDEYF